MSVCFSDKVFYELQKLKWGNGKASEAGLIPVLYNGDGDSAEVDDLEGENDMKCQQLP